MAEKYAAGNAAAQLLSVHLLDVGREPNGDAILCQFGEQIILIDGAHPADFTAQPPRHSIPEQLQQILKTAPPFPIDLLVVTHAHSDHTGCLPRLIPDQLHVRWALLADPRFRWGGGTSHTDPRMHELEAILSEEPANPDADDEVLSRLASQAEGLEDEYKAMIARLTEQGTKVVLYGTDDHTALIEQFRSIGLSILGPSQEQLRLCQEHLRSALEQTVAEYQQVPFRSPLGLYRQALSENGTILSQDAEQNGEGSVWIQSAPNSPSNFVNLESMTLMFEYNRRKLLFLGDMQLADPNVDVEQIRRAVRGLRRVIKQRAPFDFVKLAHHGSDNGFNAQVLADWMGSGLFGICGGSGDPGHPNPRVLRLLNDHRGTIRWVRTDRNGRCSITFGAAKPAIEVERGRISDPRPNASSLEVSAHVLPETGRVRLTITV